MLRTLDLPIPTVGGDSGGIATTFGFDDVIEFCPFLNFQIIRTIPIRSITDDGINIAKSIEVTEIPESTTTGRGLGDGIIQTCSIQIEPFPQQAPAQHEFIVGQHEKSGHVV